MWQRWSPFTEGFHIVTILSLTDQRLLSYGRFDGRLRGLVNVLTQYSRQRRVKRG